MAEVRPGIGIYVLTGVVRRAEAALEAIVLRQAVIQIVATHG
jgi:hypothetical protein